MNHPGHKIVKCRVCGRIVAQCRCAMPDKPIELVTCDTCAQKANQ